MPEQIAESFAQFVDSRHAANREVAVYVEGDIDNDPPLGNAAAMRVASMLAAEGEDVLRIEPEAALGTEDPDNVGSVLITLPKDPSEDEWLPVMRRLLARVPTRVDIVVLVDADSVPWFIKNLADVRVVATGIDDPVEFYRVQVDGLSGEVYYREFDGGGFDA